MITDRSKELLLDIRSRYDKYLGLMHEIYNIPKEKRTAIENAKYDIYVHVKNDFANLSIDAETINGFLESIRCPDDKHVWKPLLFHSRCEKCMIYCTHDGLSMDKCDICGAEFETGVAPFGMTSVKQD